MLKNIGGDAVERLRKTSHPCHGYGKVDKMASKTNLVPKTEQELLIIGTPKDLLFDSKLTVGC